MTQNKYIEIKLDMINKLADYIVSQPLLVKKYKDCSYVIFTSDKEFNKKNPQLIKSLQNEKKKVVKAELMSDDHGQWQFTPLY